MQEKGKRHIKRERGKEHGDIISFDCIFLGKIRSNVISYRIEKERKINRWRERDTQWERKTRNKKHAK